MSNSSASLRLLAGMRRELSPEMISECRACGLSPVVDGIVTTPLRVSHFGCAVWSPALESIVVTSADAADAFSGLCLLAVPLTRDTARAAAPIADPSTGIDYLWTRHDSNAPKPAATAVAAASQSSSPPIARVLLPLPLKSRPTFLISVPIAIPDFAPAPAPTDCVELLFWTDVLMNPLFRCTVLRSGNVGAAEQWIILRGRSADASASASASASSPMSDDDDNDSDNDEDDEEEATTEVMGDGYDVGR
jgi:hypothetical protein